MFVGRVLSLLRRGEAKLQAMRLVREVVVVINKT